ncbi:MAG: T9SS type A sorting domain-containing protein [candidate division KSB1 bacterium]|nr:T9SS type A sorting domain-containing protein [candidate division KSB1 bacterium]
MALSSLWSDDMELTIQNSRIGNIGDHFAHGGNGRLVDTRGNNVESVVIQSCTIYNMHDRLLRTGGGAVNNFVFDHNTVLHVFGRHGSFDLSNSVNVTITNNIIMNPLYQGNCEFWADEQAHTDAPDFFVVTVAADSAGDLALESFTMFNNNIWTDQQILNYYATNDSVDAPEVLSPTLKAFMGADAANAYFSEPLIFANVPPTPYDYLVQVYEDVNVEPLPENWSTIEPADIDAGYSSTSKSASAAEDGGPLGDLNNTLMAGREIVIEPGNPGILNEMIHSDTTDTGERVDPATVYVLKRGAAYLVTEPIVNRNYHLHIKAEDGAGDLPRISPAVEADGSFTQVFNTRGDATLENLYIETISPLGGSRWGGIRFYGEGNEILVDGCHVTKERGGSFQLWSDDMELTIQNSRIGNIGDHFAHGGNGRLVDTRGNNVESVVIQNCTIYNMHDRLLRTGGGGVNSFIFDHNTVLHVFGRHGSFDLSNSVHVKITNNIIKNPLYQGNCEFWADEQAHTDAPDFYVVTVAADSAGDLALESFTMSNNNIWTDQQVLDYYATNDTVDAAEVLSPTLAAFMGDAADDAYFSEVLTFENVSPTPYDYLVQVYEDVNVEPLPENWSTIEPADYNASYDAGTQSATAADDGGPLGDLNNSLTGGSSVDSKQTLPTEFDLSQNYPNPFNPSTQIEFAVSKTSDVQLIVFNMLGQQVRTLVNESRKAGHYKLLWNGRDDLGRLVPSGVYFYKLKAGDLTAVRKMIMMK